MLGTVEGTSGEDVIDATYTDDPEGETTTASADIVRALEDNDTVFGGAGNDDISGGSEDDRLYGGDGDDTLSGDEGQDILWGEAGDDVLSGGAGDDTVKGGEGADSLSGGEGADWLDGGADRDLIVGGTGDLVVSGGSEGDDFDILDLRGLPPYRLENMVRDGNGNGWNGTVVFLDPDGNPTGESFDFTEIEDFLKDPPPGPALDGTVEGTRGDDLIDLNYTGDPEGDRVDNNDAILPGAAGNDDLIYGYGGDDTILAGDGDDVAYGGRGNDEIRGGDGDDRLIGNTGDDTLFGGAGNDVLIDGSDPGGRNTVFGGSGDDRVYLDHGDDSVLGGSGNDVIYGGRGNDVIDSSAGGIGLFDNPYPPLPADPDPNDDRDVVFGGAGNDRIRTGDDRDTIDGGSGDDHLDGGIDDDSIHGQAGNDTIIGGEGADLLRGGAGDDVIYGGLDPSFPDSLNIPNDGSGPFGPDLVPQANGADQIFGGAGDDTIYGLDDDDSIFGGTGNDWIDGGVDDDVVDGGFGNDTIIGGQGNDRLTGGGDRDLFLGGNGGDHVDGSSTGDDYDTLDLTGSGVDFITYTSPDREDGIVTFLDGSTMTFEEIENVIPCFTPGTAIATPRGERLVEELRVGDRIITRDNGIQEIRWIGRKEMSGRSLVAAPHLKPVLIRAGALGHGLPERDMLVSPNHRVLVANDRTQLYFEESEVLAAAKHMVGSPGIHTVDAMSVTYIHFMFDRHEVVLSNGAWTESFQPGDWSLKGIGNAQRNELFELFPELKTREGIEGYQAARKSLRKHEARLLVR